MKSEIATLAGGCFWCTEAIYQRLKGVSSVVPGYSGGKTDNPNHISSGESGHAESIQITFEPQIIPYIKILDVFWHTHNPTTMNQQGHDHGPQYRSAIFYHNENQKRLAEESRLDFEKEAIYKDKIVTEIVPYTNFFPAEDYHHDYYEKNKLNPYCTFIISPKIHKLMQDYSKDIKEEYRQ